MGGKDYAFVAATLIVCIILFISTVIMLIGLFRSP
jgi:hypothetical protein